MKIALLGYGRMGKAIEEIALERGHEIALIINDSEDWNKKSDQLKEVDVAIDFSIPDSILANIDHCFKHQIPLVVGTTGWYEHAEELKARCEKENHAFLWASNFSIGVNIFFKVNQELARWMNGYKDYEVGMEEIHHTGKVDAPSGTAISLANGIIEQLDRKNTWTLGKSNNNEELSIEAKRIDPVPGTHTILYESDIDSIEIKHTAKNRKGFAMGSVVAAEWLKDHKGWYEFKDVFFNKA